MLGATVVSAVVVACAAVAASCVTWLPTVKPEHCPCTRNGMILQGDSVVQLFVQDRVTLLEVAAGSATVGDCELAKTPDSPSKITAMKVVLIFN